MSEALIDVLSDSTRILQNMEKEYSEIVGNDELLNNFILLVGSGMMKKDEIMKLLYISSSTYERLYKLDVVQDFLSKYTKENEKIMKNKMALMSNKALDKMGELLEKGDQKTQFAVAKDLLDRAGLKPTDKKDVNVSVSYEQNMKFFNDIGLDINSIPADFEVIDNE